MRFTGTIPLFLATAAFYSQCAAKANEEKALRVPIIPSRKDFTPIEEASLEKRETCADGSRCLFGVCCGDGCAPKCCAHDAGGGELSIFPTFCLIYASEDELLGMW
jgi:hypothetical protein